MAWPTPESVETQRFFLEPLSVEHAAKMVTVLADQSLYQFIGGVAPTHHELRRRYTAQSVGESNDASQWWLNWVIRRKRTDRLIGFVQATVEGETGSLSADISWVVAPEAQGTGAATEAARAMVDWLRKQGVIAFAASIHPQHQASMAVAKKLGMTSTSTIEHGEIRWENNTGSHR